ncbi:hypothetical protein [Iodobacter fluviatilis]|uniref:hypothetical protein n=1 Tax=Iodobacter fluviatilis TaxID=537 RepID=UPI0014051BA7|nr:hypothetical protein [Iodobacter fluviatilis]
MNYADELTICIGGLCLFLLPLIVAGFIHDYRQKTKDNKQNYRLFINPRRNK